MNDRSHAVMLKTMILAVMTAASLCVGIQPAAAQTLEERIAAVRERRAQEAAEKQAAQIDQVIEQSPRLKALQALTWRTMTVNFDQTPAREVFEYFKTSLDVPMQVHYSDDLTGRGIDPELPITLKADDALAVDVLDLVLEQCAVLEPCTWQLREGFLEVGTKERLARDAAQEVEVYPVGDLLFEPPDFEGPGPLDLNSVYERSFSRYYHRRFGRGGFGGSITPGSTGSGTTYSSGRGGSNRSDNEVQSAQELIDLITFTIEPGGWQQNGGTWASIQYRDGALIVRAPDFVHRQIGGYPRVPAPPDLRKKAESPSAADHESAKTGQSEAGASSGG